MAAPGASATASSSGSLSPAAEQEIDSRFQGLAISETTNTETYRIGSGDVLGISVFQVPELNTDVQVASNGTVNLPLVGILQANGKQAHEIGADIASKLKAKYLQSPQVTVFVKGFNSQKIVVSGAVLSPGTIPMTGDTTLVSAISNARGFTDMADPKTVMVFRRTNGHKYAARFNVNEIQEGKASDPHLMKGDVVVVDTNDVKTWVKTLLPVVTTAGIFIALL